MRGNPILGGEAKWKANCGGWAEHRHRHIIPALVVRRVEEAWCGGGDPEARRATHGHAVEPGVGVVEQLGHRLVLL